MVEGDGRQQKVVICSAYCSFRSVAWSWAVVGKRTRRGRALGRHLGILFTWRPGPPNDV